MSCEDAYARLIAAQRVVSPAERADIEQNQERDSKARRIRRKLPRVY